MFRAAAHLEKEILSLSPSLSSLFLFWFPHPDSKVDAVTPFGDLFNRAGRAVKTPRSRTTYT